MGIYDIEAYDDGLGHGFGIGILVTILLELAAYGLIRFLAG